MSASLEHVARVLAFQERQLHQATPYLRGFAAGESRAGRPPEFPRGDASWEEKLFARGWSDGADKRIRDARAQKAEA